MYSICCCSRPVWKRFLKKGTTVTYFAAPWGDMAETRTLMHVQDYEHFIPTKFRKHPLSVSVVKADYVFPYIYMH